MNEDLYYDHHLNKINIENNEDNIPQYALPIHFNQGNILYFINGGNLNLEIFYKQKSQAQKYS